MKTTAKIIVIKLLAAAILVSLPGCAATKSDFADLVREGSEVRVFEVFGMDCPGCHGGLEKLVNKIPGVRTSKANWAKQRLQVVLYPDAEVLDTAIYEAIKLANFTPGDRLK